MNRTLLKLILKEALRSCNAISEDVHIHFTDKEIPIDVRRFQNPIRDEGDTRTQSIDASERISHLINAFGKVSDFEECYEIILDGMREAAPAFDMQEGIDDEEVCNIVSNSVQEPFLMHNMQCLEDCLGEDQDDWYMQLSKDIQEIKAQGANENEHFSEDAK